MKTAKRPSLPFQECAIDGIDDTPTRTNTNLNLYLTRSHDADEDAALKGPLNMPALPNQPSETNFTFEALAKRLQQIEQHPEKALPSIFAEPSPGMLSPADASEGAVEETAEKYVFASFVNTWWN